MSLATTTGTSEGVFVLIAVHLRREARISPDKSAYRKQSSISSGGVAIFATVDASAVRLSVRVDDHSGVTLDRFSHRNVCRLRLGSVSNGMGTTTIGR